MPNIILFHGSTKLVAQPLYGLGKKNNDFGLGFYCTENENLAKEWACSSLSGGFANRYSLELADLNVLRLNTPNYTILNWLAILLKHRLFSIKVPIANRAKRYLLENFYIPVEAYDVITGYRADDSYFDFADAFLNNGITVEQLSQAMQLGKLGEQIVLKSAYAFSKIKFLDYSIAESAIYYPLRKNRNQEAIQLYNEIALLEEDGLYMADILREQVRNDDARIPRNIFA